MKTENKKKKNPTQHLVGLCFNNHLEGNDCASSDLHLKSEDSSNSYKNFALEGFTFQDKILKPNKLSQVQKYTGTKALLQVWEETSILKS